MKKNGFRLLSNSEVEKVSGGFNGILVIGGVLGDPISILGGGHGLGGDGIENPGAGSEFEMLGPGSGGFSPDVQELIDFLDKQLADNIANAIDDSSVRVVDTSAIEPLSSDQIKTVNEFKEKVAEIDKAVVSLDDNAEIRLANGDVVTGAEFKAIWAVTDFTINPQNTEYSNGTFNGQADINNGNPIASFNINIVEGFAAHSNGLTFLILHEVSHFVSPGQSLLNSVGNGATLELFTNNFARAIGNAIGLSTEFGNGSGNDPAPGFDPNFPVFISPPSVNNGNIHMQIN